MNPNDLKTEIKELEDLILHLYKAMQSSTEALGVLKLKLAKQELQNVTK